MWERWTIVDEMNEMNCGEKEIKRNMNNKVWAEGIEIKHEQWSVEWRKLNETWTIKLMM